MRAMVKDSLLVVAMERGEEEGREVVEVVQDSDPGEKGLVE